MDRKTGKNTRSNGVRSEAMLVRLEPEEKLAFQEAAHIEGIPVSAWVRQSLRKSAARILEEARRPIPFFKNLSLE